MSLTRRELFKRAFIKQCADEGLTSESQVLARIAEYMTVEKQAGLADSLTEQLNALAEQHQQASIPNDKGETGTSPWPVAVALGAAAPFAVGAGLGAVGSKLKGNWYDKDDAHQEELIAELRRQTALAKQYRRMGGTSPSSF